MILFDYFEPMKVDIRLMLPIRDISDYYSCRCQASKWGHRLRRDLWATGVAVRIKDYGYADHTKVEVMVSSDARVQTLKGQKPLQVTAPTSQSGRNAVPLGRQYLPHVQYGGP